MVVRNVVGEKRKKRLRREGMISAFDEFEFSSDGRIVVKRLSVG